MKKLGEKELETINGGIGFWGIAGIVSAVVFIVGVLDGIARPLKCNQKRQGGMNDEVYKITI